MLTFAFIIRRIIRLRTQVYEGLKYKLSLSFPSDYPFSAPTVRFETPCFHPNVDTQGNICLDILKEEWSAAYNVRTILLSIRSLLGEPNNHSPLNQEAAQLWDDQAGAPSLLFISVLCAVIEGDELHWHCRVQTCAAQEIQRGGERANLLIMYRFREASCITHRRGSLLFFVLSGFAFLAE